MVQTIQFSTASTQFYFNSSLKKLGTIVNKQCAVMVTDQNVFNAHEAKFKGFDTIVIPAGENHKTQALVNVLIENLIELKADRKTTLVGVGGGVVTDLTGYVASVYMRGIPFGFVPTTILGLVDASIGGKNGIDVGMYKNMVGAIRQPAFLLHDLSLLQSLPQTEWENGFAEIIKHAFIKDATMFKQLEKQTPNDYRENKTLLADLIQRNAMTKVKVVQKDEFEKGDRRLLNFGHTIGHAIETKHGLMHGHAVAIGMVYAGQISEQLLGFKGKEKMISLLKQYQLPVATKFNKKQVFEILAMDKKRIQKEMNFVLLQKIGKGVVHPISMKRLEKLINQL